MRHARSTFRRARIRPADGWMMVTLVNEPQYKRLCAAIGRDDLASDPRFADFAAARGFRGCADPAVARGVSDRSRRMPGFPGCMPPISSRNGSSIPANGCATSMSRRPGRRFARIRRASGRSTRRGRRALRACRRITCARRLISARTVTQVLLEAGFDRGAIDDLVKAGAVRQAKVKGGAA